MKAGWRFRKTGSEAEVLLFFASICSLLAAVLGLVIDHRIESRVVGPGLLFLIVGLGMRGLKRRKAHSAGIAGQ